jgi:S-adenosylmethionine hydrolase
VAAHLASGVALDDLGSAIADPVRLTLPKARPTATGWEGEVIHIDHFGNVASNIRAEHLGKALLHKEKISIRLAGNTVDGLVNTFGERETGEVVALLGSTGNLVVSVVNGDAASALAVRIGDRFEVALPAEGVQKSPEADT